MQFLTQLGMMSVLWEGEVRRAQRGGQQVGEEAELLLLGAGVAREGPPQPAEPLVD